MRAIGYLRVSTDEQAESGLGLEAQRERVTAEIAHRGWELAGVLVDDGATGSNMARPGIRKALELLEAGEADALVASKLDRLSRSLLDFASMMELSRRQGWALVALDLGVDTASPSGELMASVLASFAAYERRVISQRTKDALAVLKGQGQRLGRPVTLPDSTRRRIVRLREQHGWSLPKIADKLNTEGIPTAHDGARWWPETVRGVLRSVALDQEATA